MLNKGGHSMKKWYALLWNQGSASWVYNIYHCTESEISERATRYTAHSTHGIFYTYEER